MTINVDDLLTDTVREFLLSLITRSTLIDDEELRTDFLIDVTMNLYTFVLAAAGVKDEYYDTLLDKIIKGVERHKKHIQTVKQEAIQ